VAAKTVAPVLDLRAKRELAPNLDLYGRLQFAKGRLDGHHDWLASETSGHFESLGFGLDYYPLSSRRLGVEAGAELFRARHTMRGGWGPVVEVRPDQFWGYGANLGLTGTVPLEPGARWNLFWRAGHNWSVSESHHAKTNLSGWYAVVGVEIELGNKK
jgi:hypothetical protein